MVDGATPSTAAAFLRSAVRLRLVRHSTQSTECSNGGQVADAAGFESVTICSGAPLAIEDACDHSVGIELCQPANERDCVSSVRIVAGRERVVQDRSHRAPPFQRSVRRAAALSRSTLTMTSSISARSNSFLSRGVVVSACQTVVRSAPSASRRLRSSLESTHDVRFRGVQVRLGRLRVRSSSLPIRAQGHGDQPVIWIDGTITSLRTASFVACPLNPRRHCLSEVSRSVSSRSAAARVALSFAGSRAAMKSSRDGFVDLDASNVEQ